ncbi:hypothetical protein VNO77_08678 [Canavalia gladiata]|uniref:Uncharacterized protein n=1 Tax=Canavalia gladiata TaxID=3824 RepID=A0AAN9M8N3_CANGL
MSPSRSCSELMYYNLHSYGGRSSVAFQMEELIAEHVDSLTSVAPLKGPKFSFLLSLCGFLQCLTTYVEIVGKDSTFCYQDLMHAMIPVTVSHKTSMASYSNFRLVHDLRGTRHSPDYFPDNDSTIALLKTTRCYPAEFANTKTGVRPTTVTKLYCWLDVASHATGAGLSKLLVLWQVWLIRGSSTRVSASGLAAFQEAIDSKLTTHSGFYLKTCINVKQKYEWLLNIHTYEHLKTLNFKQGLHDHMQYKQNQYMTRASSQLNNQPREVKASFSCADSVCCVLFEAYVLEPMTLINLELVSKLRKFQEARILFLLCWLALP